MEDDGRDEAGAVRGHRRGGLPDLDGGDGQDPQAEAHR